VCINQHPVAEATLGLDYPPAPGMDIDVLGHNGLVVTTPVLIQRLDQLQLELAMNASSKCRWLC
jgi:hypothetical protein